MISCLQESLSASYQSLILICQTQINELQVHWILRDLFSFLGLQMSESNDYVSHSDGAILGFFFFESSHLSHGLCFKQEWAYG